MLLLLGISLLPVVVLFSYIYWRDKYEKEPLHLLVKSFLWGCFSCLPAIWLTYRMEDLGFRAHDPTLAGKLAGCILGIGFSEELAKYIFLRFYMYPKQEFDEPYDGIMYSVAISLGFAGLENILYVMDGGMTTGILRMFTAVPGHTMFAVLMGYFVGLAKVNPNPVSAAIQHILGFTAAMVVHGLYDFFLMSQVEMLIPFAFVVLIVGILLARRAMTLHNQNSPHQTAPVNPFRRS